jgi:AbrB family looped-hinge helix DNA binding protein
VEGEARGALPESAENKASTQRDEEGRAPDLTVREPTQCKPGRAVLQPPTAATPLRVAGPLFYTYHYHMEEIITIDGAGRLVVPKAMRQRLGLRKGSRLWVREEAGARLVLEPVAEESVPVDVDGLLVIRGRVTGPMPDHREQRAARIRELGGAET